MHRKVFRINEEIIVEGLEKTFMLTCSSRDTTVKLFFHYAIRFAYTLAYKYSSIYYKIVLSTYCM